MREPLAALRWVAGTPEETEAYGARLARALPLPHAALGVVFLSGELGAGKTTFARGFLHALGVTGPVRSPTYALLECYELPESRVVHLDLYRLRAPEELETLGLRDLARPGHVWLIEWPERGTGRLPAPDLAIELSAGPGGAHTLAVTAASPLGREWLARAG